MNHHLKVINTHAKFINQAFGVSQIDFQNTVNFLAERLTDHFHQKHFQVKDPDPNCTFIDTLFDSLEELSAEKNIFPLEGANAYFVLGMAFTRALDEAMETIEDSYIQLHMAQIEKQFMKPRDKSKIN